MHADRAVFVQHDPTFVECLHGPQIIELHRTVVLRLDDRLLKCLTGRAADVECSHRQLRPRFADRLRGDNTDSFTELHEVAGGEVATVAHRAHASATLACEHRPDLELLDADTLQVGCDLFVDVLVCLDDLFLFIHRVADCFAAHAPYDALAKVDDFLVAFVNRAHHDAVYGTAIVFNDDNILRRVHEFAGEITGVRGFQRRIGKTFARTVGGNEVLQHGQAFAEI